LNEESCHQAQKERHFCIAGDICITETIMESEMGSAEEISTGMNEKSNTCTTLNAASGSSGTGAVPTNLSTCGVLTLM